MNSILLTPTTKEIKADLEIPGSKSYTNRALILASMVEKPVTIINPLIADDTLAMVSCLQNLGIEIQVSTEKIVVVGSIKDISYREYELNANLSGVTIRSILALCCVVPGVKILSGKESLNKRPIAELVNGLRQLGASIEYLDKEGFPPLKITSSHLNSGICKLKGDISSQYFSAIMQIAPIVGNIEIQVDGEQISKSYIDMTIDTMNTFGVKVVNQNYRKYIIPNDQNYNLLEYQVEGDFSGAGYFFAIAALTRSTLTLKNLNSQSKQGDFEFVTILEKMGNEITLGDNQITIKGNGIKITEVNMENCPDQAQTLAVLSAFAPGISKLTGIKSLRVKETERVKAIQSELAKMNIKTESPDEDTLIIYGGKPQPATIDTYHDHRMAMSFAVAGTHLSGVIINDPEATTKTFPTFWHKLEEIGVGIENIQAP